MRAWQSTARRHLLRSPSRFLRQQLRGAASIGSTAVSTGTDNDSTTTLTPALLVRARSMAASHATLAAQLADGYDASAAKKMGELQGTASALREWEAASAASTELQQLLDDPDADAELRAIAVDEVEATNIQLDACATALKTALVPPHPFAGMPCLLELRPGAGGSEAAIFAADLLAMYTAWCRRHKLRVSLIKHDTGDTAGGADAVHDAVLEIESPGAYGLLRSEAGVHRVQRVPATETKGRTHTSAVGVLVLPSFPENPGDELGAASFNDPTSDYYIDPSDVKTDVMRASGAGGQHVNKTESKVRLTHTPTNTVVTMSDSRSQLKNREKAWQILRSKIAQARREAREDEVAKLRTSTIGIAKLGRGDKIRTYNYGQQRVTDHRSGCTLHNLDDCMEGGLALDDVMLSVRTWQSEQDLMVLMAEEEMATKETDKGK